jgi:HD-GYP domain-containing protein (c-di-GMP phosphodiesterase class II)
MVARVVAVVDAFDAMTTNDLSEAARRRGSDCRSCCALPGVQFDADVVTAFQKAFPDVEKLPITV